MPTIAPTSRDGYYVHREQRIPLYLSTSFKGFRWSGDKRLDMALPNRGSRGQPISLPRSRTLLIPRHMAGGMLHAPGGTHETPVFERPDGSVLVPHEEAIVAASGCDERAARDLALSNKAELVGLPSRNYPHYRMKALDGDAISLANRLAEQQGIAAQPAFTVLIPRQRACVACLALPTQHSENWALNKTKVTEAWALTRGSPEVTIAILDTGVQLLHPELKANLVPGWDSHDDDPDPDPGVGSAADLGHGTSCAGIAVGRGNNAFGITGVAPESRAAPYRIGHVNGLFIEMQPGALAKSIREAADRGARIQANSYTLFDDALEDVTGAIEYAVTKRGCLFVAAAGNDDGRVGFPAKNPHAMAIAATNNRDERCGPADWGIGYGSAQGREISVAAPGSHVWTADLQGSGGYNPGDIPQAIHEDYTTTFGGTSAACPFVAGIAALILSVSPALGPEEVRGILEATADKKESREPYFMGRNDSLGHGRVNALAAVEMALRKKG